MQAVQYEGKLDVKSLETNLHVFPDPCELGKLFSACRRIKKSERLSIWLNAIFVKLANLGGLFELIGHRQGDDLFPTIKSRH